MNSISAFLDAVAALADDAGFTARERAVAATQLVTEWQPVAGPYWTDEWETPTAPAQQEPTPAHPYGPLDGIPAWTLADLDHAAESWENRYRFVKDQPYALSPNYDPGTDPIFIGIVNRRGTGPSCFPVCCSHNCKQQSGTTAFRETQALETRLRFFCPPGYRVNPNYEPYNGAGAPYIKGETPPNIGPVDHSKLPPPGGPYTIGSPPPTWRGNQVRADQPETKDQIQAHAAQLTTRKDTTETLANTLAIAIEDIIEPYGTDK